MSDKIIKAQTLSRTFFEREPRATDFVTVGPVPAELGVVIGKVHGISYVAEISKEPFFHRFNANDRPLLVISSDGTQAYILKGGYRFTDRGFIG